MATLHYLKILNFRSIEYFEQYFKSGILCVIGRGDSGKSTILDAISSVFSSNWGLHFYDSDFFNCNTEHPIEIEATIINIPEKLLAKYGSYIRGVLPDGSIIDDMETEAAEGAQSALTIKLIVTKDLEPQWLVVSYRGQDPVSITATDRNLVNCFSVSDYTDRHFSLNKGNPLYTLYKQLSGEEVQEGTNVVLEVIRQAKTNFDATVAEKFQDVIDKIADTASELGIQINDVKASLDHRDISLGENKVCLHETGIPFRLKGRGSKRLLSLAIQLSLTKPSGIILIDEIEQGLEPDRVQHLVNVLSKYKDAQVVITTHSSNVIKELPSGCLHIMRLGAKSLLPVGTNMQGCVRANPEAFFAKKVLVCEGATEMGICRAINEFRIREKKVPAACLGIQFVDGGGDSMVSRVCNFKSLGYDCCLFCDSDKENINNQKADIISKDIVVISCQENNAIEQQIFNDITWAKAKTLVEYYADVGEKESQAIFDSVNSKLANKRDFVENWMDIDSLELRQALGNAAKVDYKTKPDGSIREKGGWFKRQDHGYHIGTIVLSTFEDIGNEVHLKQMFNGIINWIEA
nr:MAG TPA: AAA domain protein [Caudoviricetes sp.]